MPINTVLCPNKNQFVFIINLHLKSKVHHLKMGRLEVFTVCLIFAITLNSAESKVIDSNNDDILIDAIFEDLATSLSENQEIKKLYPLIQEQLSDNKLQITYRLGSRVNGE